MSSPLLQEIESRAGASDQDREAWLRERTTGVTATEAKRLMQDVPPEVLALEKVVGTDFQGNRYTAWGKVREPVVAREVQRTMPYLMEEHRVFRARQNPRHLASPDMVGVHDGALILAEIKTSGKDITNPHVLAETGYLYQMQWQMYVLGSPLCYLVAERHNGVWSIPGPLTEQEESEVDGPVPEDEDERARLSRLASIREVGPGEEVPEVVFPPTVVRAVARDEALVAEMVERADAALSCMEEIAG